MVDVERLQRRWPVVGVVVLLVLVSTAFGLFQVSRSRTFQFAGELVDRVGTDRKVVALTFDDGPGARTPEVVRTLDELGVRATFFVVGSELHAHPEHGRDLVRAGHELGNHTYSHERMVLVSAGFVADEVERTDAEIRAAGWTGDIHFRPPNGKKLFALPSYLADHHRKTIMWDVESDSEDTPTAADVVKRTTDEVRPGSIVLLHVWPSSRQSSWDAVPEIVRSLKARGYTFVTVSQLLGQDAATEGRMPPSWTTTTSER
ncbi:MAG: polysaccharide deacetylase family protein [Umezawaea sp.]